MGLALVVLLVVVVVAIGLGHARPTWSPWFGVGAALVAAVAFGLVWALDAHPTVELPWLGPMGSALRLELDPLAAPLVVFTTFLAAPILAFTRGYLPAQLARHARPDSEQARFVALMLAFMTAMVLLLVAQDLLIMFVALEGTAIVSFALIEFDRASSRARNAALWALVITVGASLLFVVGAFLVLRDAGTMSLPDLASRASDRSASPLAAGCLVFGVLAKSAQVPFHVWLPRAMVAPTPVSAYLHSATLVAAGVFVLMRLSFLIADAAGIGPILQAIGFLSIFVGATMALHEDRLKRILAYSTIAQYGYVLVMLGVGGAAGWVGAPLFLVAHGLCKCALFLTAGALATVLGRDRLSELGGAGRSMPLLAFSSAVVGLGLAGFPGTVGWFKDEALFEVGTLDLPRTVLTTLAVALTVAYTVRFWWGAFVGTRHGSGRPPAAYGLVLPVALLGVVVLLGGLWPGAWRSVFDRAGSVVAGRTVVADLAYHAELRAPTVMAVVAWTLGIVLAVARRWWQRPLAHLVRAVSRAVGPDRWARRLVVTTVWVSGVLHDLEIRDLRARLRSVLLPMAILVALALIARGRISVQPFALELSDAPLVVGLIVVAGAAVAATRAREHLHLFLLLSFVGFGLALVLALSGAPDVALVVVLVETALTVLFVALLWQFGPAVLERVRRAAAPDTGSRWIGVLTGAAVFVVAWVSLTSQAPKTVAWRQIRLAESAHAQDVVSAIIADFRGLDTAGEITVLGVALLGAAAIGWGRSS